MSTRIELIRLLIFGFLLSGPALSQANAGGRYEDLYSNLLGRYTQSVAGVVGTRVDYAGLRREQLWPQLIVQLAAVQPQNFFRPEEKLAFWINAYNILAIDLVVQHAPRQSIREIGSFFRSVWKMEAGKIGGRGYSLDQIEDEILRPLGEPRIHAAIVCASISCPSLARSPYRANQLNAQLEASSRAWLRSPEKGFRLDREQRVLKLSPILDWFEDDFGGARGVREFVVRHVPKSEGRWLKENPGEYRVRYFRYDWQLNR